MDPDIEVVFDLPVGTHRPRHPASQQLDVEVQRMRRALVLTRHDATRPGGSAVEALELLEVHRTAGEGVGLSALLVCTHRRFERCARALMRRLEESDLLADDHLDVLAMVLLAEDRVRFAIPAAWWGGEVDVLPGRRVRASGYELVPVGDDEQTWPYVQDIPAAARRWAVRRLLERQLVTVEAALERIGELDQPGTGGAVLSGVLDAWACLRAADLQQAIDEALASTLASVRCRALDVLALTGRLEEARALARDDGAAKVRTWQPPAALTPPAQPSLL